MKRTIAAVVTAVTAGASIWLASAPANAAPANAAPKPPKPTSQPNAWIKAEPAWAYQGTGKIAILATCAPKQDNRVITSNILRRPIELKSGWNLLIKVSDKTSPGKYTITLWCVAKHGQVNAFAETTVKVVKRLKGWHQPAQPKLPRNFKAGATVLSGPPVTDNSSHHTKPVKKASHHASHHVSHHASHHSKHRH